MMHFYSQGFMDLIMPKTLNSKVPSFLQYPTLGRTRKTVVKVGDQRTHSRTNLNSVSTNF